MRELGLVYSYIYRGFFSNFRITGSGPSPGTGRVSGGIFYKTQTYFGFFFKPIPDLIPYRTG